MNTSNATLESLDVTSELVDPAISAERFRAARRASRMWSLENVRDACVEMVLRLNDGTACRLPFEQQQAHDRLSSPYLDVERVTRSLRRIIALEEQLDEDSETRAARIAADQAAREREQQDKEDRDADQPLREKKKLVRKAIRTAHEDSEPQMEPQEREDLLNDLFNDYEDLDDYDGDLAEIVAVYCARLGLSPAVKPLPEGQEETLEQEKARAVAFAQGYIDIIMPRGAANRNIAEPAPAEAPEPQAKGRSPPG